MSADTGGAAKALTCLVGLAVGFALLPQSPELLKTIVGGLYIAMSGFGLVALAMR